MAIRIRRGWLVVGLRLRRRRFVVRIRRRRSMVWLSGFFSRSVWCTSRLPRCRFRFLVLLLVGTPQRTATYASTQPSTSNSTFPYTFESLDSLTDLLSFDAFTFTTSATTALGLRLTRRAAWFCGMTSDLSTGTRTRSLSRSSSFEIIPDRGSSGVGLSGRETLRWSVSQLGNSNRGVFRTFLDGAWQEVWCY